MLPILISTPHSSTYIPDWIWAEMLKTGETEPALRQRILREGDPYTDIIFNLKNAKVILNANAARFVADLNRDRTELGENGVIKLTDFQRVPFYPESYILTEAESERRLTQFYAPFHQSFATLLASGQIKFFIDGHSMTEYGPAIGPDQGKRRPAICIGNFGDANGNALKIPLSCPKDLTLKIANSLRKHLRGLLTDSGFSTEISLNDPFDGGAILKNYSNAPYRIPGVMIEINRALYLDEPSLKPIPGRMEKLNQALNTMVGEILI